MPNDLVVVEQNANALVAVASLDGIAGAAIWAHQLSPLKAFLFAAEGAVGHTLSAPALGPDAGIKALHFIGLPLMAEDMEALRKLIDRPDFTEVRWLDHHYLHADHVSLMQRHGVRIINDTRVGSSTRLLLDSLSEPPEWGGHVYRALEAGIEAAGDPWRQWLLVFLAVRESPFDIRHAIAPLIDERFEAFDPALVEAGEEIWRRIRAMAESPMHEVEAGGLRLVVSGLPPSELSTYRLMIEAIARHRDADLVIAAFDRQARLVVAAPRVTSAKIDLLEIGERIVSAGLNVFHYDAGTLFIDTADLSVPKAVDRIIAVVTTGEA
ncbi:MAG: hypothetical protein P9L99_19235 [Candidatus Lernaella stagnicola]|nr:hypothetical protein [Candidatus Lernaella stagnicola]